jgi:enoyl-CoA hydratase/carnithine racemase
LLPTCRALASDILSTDPTTRRKIKRIMDAGWHSTLEKGLAIELDASHAHGRAEVTREKVAARRAAIQSRGREQSR